MLKSQYDINDDEYIGWKPIESASKKVYASLRNDCLQSVVELTSYEVFIVVKFNILMIITLSDRTRKAARRNKRND